MGSVVGVVGALAIVGAILVFLRRRKSSADGPGFLVEPYQPSMAVLAPASVSAPASMSPPPSTASASKRSGSSYGIPRCVFALTLPYHADPVVSAWDPNTQPADASGRDLGVEERLRHLESLVGASALRGSSASPPAYGQ